MVSPGDEIGDAARQWDRSGRRTVFLSGPAGSGKTTVLRLGQPTMTALWGQTAAIDTDVLFAMVDPNWELPYDDVRTRLVLRQAAHLARSFFDAGYPNVLIAGNAIHSPAILDAVLPDLLAAGRVFHVTLVPSEEAVLARVASDPRRDPRRVAADVRLLASNYRDWSIKIDNSELSPREALAEIARRVVAGDGELTRPFHATGPVEHL